MRIVLIAVPLLLAACGMADAGSTRDSGPRATRDYPLTGFTEVALKGSDDVVVRVGPAFSVRAEAPQALLDKLELVVENGALKVGRKDGAWEWGKRDMHARITVTMPALAAAAVAGSGDMTVDRVAGANFSGAVGGSGDLTIGVIETGALKLDVAGSGDITATGRAASADYSVAGSGDIAAGAVEARALAVSVAGSGNVAARSTSPARVSIVGSGDVTVTGAPCTVSKVGSGDATCG